MITLIKTDKDDFQWDVKDFLKKAQIARETFFKNIVIVNKGKFILVQCSDIIFDRIFKRVPKYIKLIPKEFGRVILTRYNYKNEIYSEIGVPSKNWAKKYGLYYKWEKKLLIK